MRIDCRDRAACLPCQDERLHPWSATNVQDSRCWRQPGEAPERLACCFITTRPLSRQAGVQLPEQVHVGKAKRRELMHPQPRESLSDIARPSRSAVGAGRVQRHGRANESLQCLPVNLFALVKVDGTPGVAIEAGVEEA